MSFVKPSSCQGLTVKTDHDIIIAIQLLTDLLSAVQRGEKIQDEALIASQLIESDDEVLVEVGAHSRAGKFVCFCSKQQP